MKTKIALSVVAVLAVTFFLIDHPLAIMEKTAPSKSDVPFPLNLECVVTIENEGWRDNPRPKVPGPPSGFLPDFTIQGKLIHVGSDWIVIKEGTYENWISRDKVVNIRASR